MTYDFVGNKTLIKFPDLKTQQWLDYDAFGQAGRFIDERGQTTNMVYWLGPMKKLRFVTTHRAKDGGGMEDQQTGFWCDGIGRPTETDFPDTSYEQVGYVNGQMSGWRNRKGNLKHLFYDARKRETYETWDGDAAPRIDRVWDDTNRLTSIANLWSTISYTYDDAGQVLMEGNAIAGSAGSVPTRYHRYADGEVSEIMYPYGRFFRRDYTARGQLATAGVSDGSGNWVAGIVTYHYLADGKVDSLDYYNGVQSKFAYDGRGMIQSVRHFRPADTHNLAQRTYWRDDRDRIYAWAKGTDASLNPMENGRGDHYWYDNEGQLTGANYQAADPSGSASNPERVDSFSYDALGNRQGSNQLASRGSSWNWFTRTDNGLNQYTNWTPSVINYDDDLGPPWGSPAQANGVLMQDGTVTASYNALNQPRAISIPAPGSNFMWFGFDPLGRCVKRWIGPDVAPNGPPASTNPATYLYYEGWNLLQEGPASGGWIWNGSAFVMGAGGGMTKCYLHGARVDEIVMSAVLPSGALTFHHYDARGHCILLSDSGGNIAEQYDYDAFGKPYFYNGYGQALPNGSNYGNRFLFTGREWLSEVKLYDYRNRLYQPELGRFLQPDPKQFAAGDYNLYRYCHNDPVNKSDPTGLGYEEHMSPPEAYQGGVFLHLSRLFDSLSGAGVRATWDAQSRFGDTSGKFAVQQGFQATKDYGNINAGEAVRHEVWQSELTRKWGESAARAIADAHEKGETDRKDSARDQYNSELGRENGKSSTGREDSLAKARKDWETGKSALDKNDRKVSTPAETGKSATDKNDSIIPAPKEIIHDISY